MPLSDWWESLSKDVLAEIAVKSKRGGARVGAGRPDKLAVEIRKAEQLVKQLAIGVRPGLLRLSESYDKLMELAIAMALGTYTNGTKPADPTILKPDPSILMKLIEILPRIVGPEIDSEESPMRALLGDIRKRVVNIQVNNYDRPLVDGNLRVRVEPVEDNPVQGVGQGSSS